MTVLGLAITIASIWAVFAFGLVGLFIYRYCKFCRYLTASVCNQKDAITTKDA